MEFSKTFSSLDCPFTSTLNNYSKSNTTATTVHTFSEQGISSKIIKTENISVDGSISPRRTVKLHSQSLKKEEAKRKTHWKQSPENLKRKSKNVMCESSTEPNTQVIEKSTKENPGRKSKNVICESSTEPNTKVIEKSTKENPGRKSMTMPAISLKPASKINKQLYFVKIFERACVVCKQFNETIKCTGSCQKYFHKECFVISNQECNKKMKLKNVKKDSVQRTSIFNIEIKSTNELLKKESKNICSSCKANKTDCFICGLLIDDTQQKLVCKLDTCKRYYHRNCLEEWPQCQWSEVSPNTDPTVMCPHHVCHLCISSNPENACKAYFPDKQLIRCIKCPTSYHRSEYCLPAGSEILTYFDIVCSRHFEPIKTNKHHFNTSWCIICTEGGGTLVCCDLCPNSFHVNCLNQNPSKFENRFICEECQCGRYPLYNEIVWTKIGNYRWWPAKIIFPDQVPHIINVKAHSVGEFAVQFCGTHDYCWVNRGQVFFFHEGDENNVIQNNKKTIDRNFQDAIIEASQEHSRYILNKDKNNDVKTKQCSIKPPKYVPIKVNKPFGNVKIEELGTKNMSPCDCNPNQENPCGLDSDCINRILTYECHPKLCRAGHKCNNQNFEKRLYPKMVPFLTKHKGWGLKTLVNIKEGLGSFIIEYVGDVIDKEEFQKRCHEMSSRNDQNYYFLAIDNSRIIDAGLKGNMSRFLNHSCEPNCVTQKWIVNGNTRIGFFALQDITAGTELVFDYCLESCSGVEKIPCQCEAARCSKLIGVKVIN
ncbi:Zinc finger, PHD-type,Zinc finger, RING-type,PWWP domain,Zinc finger, RING/FYVE/PHD-type,Zinc [Cinara cedri]|uniref:Zinc finger, PHD-type,Zinc finger, RING-type,PWWP domain,Zinc finger, RING/FYVE/PHD-type,Zinc n=1 Tax=Cinara cedri TaxID=506608 RepID=A0A5E4MT54_9HEMI|nr:Zinc finger, PHD-type,Zinc finger, RING-type,PWWP domain,Zinc finger, RING/FYVE/PHD-type,Zinc [Cinara cedri]